MPWTWYLGGLITGYSLFRLRREKAHPVPDINIDAEPVDLVHVNLVGKPYDIKPPKAALAMRLATEAKLFSDDPAKMMDVLNAWIRRAFGDKAEKIQKRLDDEDDDLDIFHIMMLMEKIIEVQTDATPTT